MFYQAIIKMITYWKNTLFYSLETMVIIGETTKILFFFGKINDDFSQESKRMFAKCLVCFLHALR